MTVQPFHRAQADLLGERPPPPRTVGTIGWLRANLFSSWFNAGLTLIALYVLWLIIPAVLEWAFFTSDFAGEDRERRGAEQLGC